MGTSQVGFAPFNHPLIGTVTVQLHSVWFIRRKKQDFLGMFPIWATSLLGMSSTNKHSKIWLSLCFQLFVILFNFEHQATCVFLSSFSTLLIAIDRYLFIVQPGAIQISSTTAVISYLSNTFWNIIFVKIVKQTV